MDYNTNCDSGSAMHYIMDFNVGVCEVSEHAEFNHRNCIKWDDKQKWEEIDDQTGYDTTMYATKVFPHVLRLRSAYSTAIIIQVLTSLTSLCKPLYSLHCQYFIVVISVVYVLLVADIQLLTSDNDVVNEEVWKILTGCEREQSGPYVSFYSLNFAQIFGMIIVLISTVPNRIVCFQFVSAGDGIRRSLPSNTDCHNNSLTTSSLTTITPIATLHDPILKISYSIDGTLPSPPELSVDMSPMEKKILIQSIDIESDTTDDSNRF